MSAPNAPSADLVAALQQAMSIELATLPAYLYARWSLVPRSGGGSVAAVEAAALIRSVTYEEMLHMALVLSLIHI